MAGETAKNDPIVKEGKLFAMVAYLWILCLIPLFLKKDNKFALFHGKQGLVLFIGEIALKIIAIIPLLGWFVASLGLLVFGIFSIVGIVQALMGNYWKMPIIGDIAEKINL